MSDTSSTTDEGRALGKARERIEALQVALEEAAPDWLPDNLSEKANVIIECAAEFSMRLARARKALDEDRAKNGLC